MLVTEEIGVKEGQKIVKDPISSSLSKKKVSYSLKYSRKMLMLVEGDMDVRLIFKGGPHTCDDGGYVV